MEENKYISLDKLTLYDDLIKAFINSQIFIGTYEEYETAYANGKIPINALVVITDDETSGGGSDTTAALGYAILGQMILG